MTPDGHGSSEPAQVQRGRRWGAWWTQVLRWGTYCRSRLRRGTQSYLGWLPKPLHVAEPLGFSHFSYLLGCLGHGANPGRFGDNLTTRGACAVT